MADNIKVSCGTHSNLMALWNALCDNRYEYMRRIGDSISDCTPPRDATYLYIYAKSVTYGVYETVFRCADSYDEVSYKEAMEMFGGSPMKDRFDRQAFEEMLAM